MELYYYNSEPEYYAQSIVVRQNSSFQRFFFFFFSWCLSIVKTIIKAKKQMLTWKGFTDCNVPTICLCEFLLVCQLLNTHMPVKHMYDINESKFDCLWNYILVGSN